MHTATYICETAPSIGRAVFPRVYCIGRRRHHLFFFSPSCLFAAKAGQWESSTTLRPLKTSPRWSCSRQHCWPGRLHHHHHPVHRLEDRRRDCHNCQSFTNTLLFSTSALLCLASRLRWWWSLGYVVYSDSTFDSFPRGHPAGMTTSSSSPCSPPPWAPSSSA